MDAALIALLWKSYATGWAVAAPIGPVNLEIIRRGLHRNLLGAFMVGLGACCIDALYFTVFSMGMGSLLSVGWVRSAAYLLGGVFLVWLGIGALREARAFGQPATAAQQGAPPPQAAGAPQGRLTTPLGSFLVGLGMTASNPMTIAFWSALSLKFADLDFAHRLLASGMVLAGCLSWVLLLTLVLGWARRFVGPGLFGAVTLLGGAVVLYFGLSFIAQGARLEELAALWMAP